MILYNNLIPLSLVVTVELVKFVQVTHHVAPCCHQGLRWLKHHLMTDLRHWCLSTTTSICTTQASSSFVIHCSDLVIRIRHLCTCSELHFERRVGTSMFIPTWFGLCVLTRRQVQYIFSDKTGTLTRNIMVFLKATIAGISYGDVVTEVGHGHQLLPCSPRVVGF